MRLIRTAAALVVGGSLALAAPASATTYADAVQLSWDDVTYASSTTESFIGVPVAVPGDSASRTLHVRNAGPTAGTLTATITAVELEGAVADGVYSDLLLSWPGGSSTFADLAAGGDTTFLTVPLDHGATTPVTLTYSFPEDSTAGNRADNGASAVADFDVVLTLSGELPTTEPTGPTTEPTDGPTTGPTDGPSATATATSTGAPTATAGPTGPLGQTGAEVTWAAAGALALLAGGAGLWAAARRRRHEA